MSFNHYSIEKKWQQKWEKGNLSAAADDSPKEKFYVLVEFPYPSGDGLHVGHCRSYTALDAVARKKRMEGKNVLFPIGFDAFGLPTENYAIKNKIQPRVATDKNIANFTKQLKSIGFSFDWNHVIDTTDPKYFKWTQWIFLQFFKKNLAYQAEIPINWCLSCKIGLANEEVVNGKCERCGGEIERRVKKQWMLKITEYADRLLQDLETVDYLPRIKTQQQNWIGRSEGASVQFSVNNVQCAIEVFTTRPDTLFGCTYTVLAPEHELLQKLKPKIENWKEVEKYIQEAAKKSDLERGELNKEKTGVELKGVKAVNPVNGEEIPIFVADYVLASYGTGAIMAVPAHDERDFEFAKKFGVEIKYVIFNTQQVETVEETDSKIVHQTFTHSSVKNTKQAKWMEEKLIKKNKPQTQKGLLINSGEFTGLHSSEAIPKIIAFLKKKKVGKAAVNFKLRDWIFSRQRYWGEPIPIVHCEKCGVVPAVADFAKYLQKKKGEDVLSKQASTGGSTQVCRIDSPNKKEGGTRSGTIVPTGGSPYVCLANPSNSHRILASLSYKCKSKFKHSKTNNRKSLKATFEKLGKIRSLNSKIFGKVDFNWWYLWQHFQKKRFQEALIRAKFAPAAVEILENAEFVEESQKEKDCFLVHGKCGRRVFTVVVEKVKKKIRIKTFYQSKKTTQAWRELAEKFSLPLELPEVENYQPTDSGESPLAGIEKWVNTTCPQCGGKAKRETDTMPNWAGSSWYFLRYIDPRNSKEFASAAKLKKWLPVDLYNGGMEHTVLHLLYSRFWHKFLFDLKLVPTAEPYAKRISHGMILGSDGEKMSKSRGNVVNPDEIVAKFGADTLRIYELFIGPFDQAAAWNEGGVEGVHRFLEKVWRLSEKVEQVEASEEFNRILHKTIKKVSEDLDAFHFNTAVSSLMIFVNEATRLSKFPHATFAKFLTLLAPFAPHLAEELWEKLGNKNSIHLEAWPAFDENLAKDETINLVIQVNGKLRDTVEVAVNIEEAEALELAKKSEKVAKWIEGKEIQKEIFVPGKLVNFVVS